MLGGRPAEAPATLRRLRAELGGRIVVDGRLDTEAYHRVLAGAAIVVSTAIHEFQGLAVMEAAGAGCRPLVPDALCYREQYPADYRYPSGDGAALCDRLRRWLGGGLPPAVDIAPWREAVLLPRWKTLLGCSELCQSPSRSSRINL